MEFPMEWVCETLGERKRVAEAVVPALKDKSIEESFFCTLKTSQIGGRYFRCGVSVFLFLFEKPPV